MWDDFSCVDYKRASNWAKTTKSSNTACTWKAQEKRWTFLPLPNRTESWLSLSHNPQLYADTNPLNSGAPVWVYGSFQQCQQCWIGSEAFKNKTEASITDTRKQEQKGRSSLQNMWHPYSHCVEAECMIWQETTAYSSEDPSLDFGIFHFQVENELVSFQVQKSRWIHTVAKNKFCKYC